LGIRDRLTPIFLRAGLPESSPSWVAEMGRMSSV